MKLKKKLLISFIAFVIVFLTSSIISKNNLNEVQASVNTKKDNGTLTVRYTGAKVYGKNGMVLKKYRGSANNSYLKAGTVVKYYGKPKYMNRKIFYYIGDEGYILGYNVESLDGAGTLSVYHNSYVYNKSGKRIKGILIRKGMPVKYLGKLSEKSNNSQNMPKYYYFSGYNQAVSKKMIWVKYKTINKQQYYKIARNKYIKAKNIGYINGHHLYASEGTITLGTPYIQPENKYYIWTKNGKMTKKIFSYKKGEKVVVDRWISIDGFSFFRVKGTDYYIIGTDVKKMPIQQIRY